ncbi:MAG: GNAT family N-acetyltransferase [Bacteroidales bacterium]|jgi:ribosomal protein S18 acetylase RimI-like enzyme|nr:GNAT family N-acetyltransferase [Bacteroidales bacterium]
MATEKLVNAHLEHLPAIIQIEQMSFGTDAFNIRQMRYLIRSQNPFYIFLHNKIVAGYMILLLRKNVSVIRIYAIAIHPDFRGKGLASSFLDKAIQTASEMACSKISLEVKTINQAAISLYQQKGFKVSELLTQYYKDGADGYKMVLTL